MAMLVEPTHANAELRVLLVSAVEQRLRVLHAGTYVSVGAKELGVKVTYAPGVACHVNPGLHALNIAPDRL